MLGTEGGGRCAHSPSFAVLEWEGGGRCAHSHPGLRCWGGKPGSLSARQAFCQPGPSPGLKCISPVCSAALLWLAAALGLGETPECAKVLAFFNRAQALWSLPKGSVSSVTCSGPSVAFLPVSVVKPVVTELQENVSVLSLSGAKKLLGKPLSKTQSLSFLPSQELRNF